MPKDKRGRIFFNSHGSDNERDNSKRSKSDHKSNYSEISPHNGSNKKKNYEKEKSKDKLKNDNTKTCKENINSFSSPNSTSSISDLNNLDFDLSNGSCKFILFDRFLYFSHFINIIFTFPLILIIYIFFNFERDVRKICLSVLLIFCCHLIMNNLFLHLINLIYM